MFRCTARQTPGRARTRVVIPPCWAYHNPRPLNGTHPMRRKL
nr:MAG TPA: hypothetical protein [Caudoviricetes sp.]